MNPRFSNPWPHPVHRIRDILRWKLGIRFREPCRLPNAPAQPAGWRAVDASHIASPPATGWRVTWLGHASFLLQGCGRSLLVDPMLSEHCGPIPLPSLKRKAPPPCGPCDLPEIDAVLITHSHYDHLDLTTLRDLRGERRLLVAEGHAGWLQRKGFGNAEDVRWHETCDLGGGLRITATPAQHFTARSFHDHNRAHWCGWLVDGGACRLWHAGDSGYCEAFRAIGARYGPIDFGMIPIGAYQPRQLMRPMHMDPAEAARVFLDTRCRRAVGMHWGTFRLTDEPLGEPPLLLAAALQELDIDPASFTTGHIGQSWEIHPAESPVRPHQ
jgi:N-acyl-phosphatidylethanolamine-hydrolysing phospholipase D